MIKKFKLDRIKKKHIILGIIVLAVAIYFLIPDRESIYVGTIEVTEVDVAPRVASQIAERVVDEGDLVKTGDILYKLTCENIYVDAEKSFNDFKRAEKLLASGNMSPEQYDTYKKNYENSKLQVEWCTVRAPIDGTILTKFHEAGEYVYTGSKLMAMGDLNDVWAYVYVDQPFLASLSIGQEVTGYLPELNNKTIAGQIIHIKDEAEFTPKNVQTRKERTRLVYGIKIRFDNSEKLLKPGMPIEVRFAKLNK
ncbi:MAG: efflux RND transporter periplasmic adaptor subunit [Pseudomonadota bacterium]